ncbi:prephenate dehydrogenase [Acutalibacter sp. 1XD8-33]|uniref:prephenate dehydrogenase n=1 Tax=Acutalibacter sp. 1XD8-33 TaxID=2320081 RepID=UPI000EA247FB|nr:prephenate dehydrogenase [Acutalibacter sp. 1XD8-33]RKJ42167.1 prephenate dehydrogenase [Acutalibacter sp. 1XD8-33]
MKIVIVGLGLIGGSIAKSLKQNTGHQVLGIDRDQDALLDACSCGAIDGKASRDDLKTADLVYLCVYPEGALEFAKESGPMLKEGCVLTDTCGVKGAVCAGMEGLGGNYAFVAGHPMAGKEHSGFSASDPSIFVGASYIIADTGAPDWAVERVEGLARAMGFGRVVHTAPQRHDQLIAFTSQAPHALACGYVMSPRCREHQGFSAGSYRDVSRVADINAALWTRLFLDNREALVEELDELERNLRAIRDAVAQGDEDRLRRLLQKAGEIKRQVG